MTMSAFKMTVILKIDEITSYNLVYQMYKYEIISVSNISCLDSAKMLSWEE